MQGTQKLVCCIMHGMKANRSSGPILLLVVHRFSGLGPWVGMQRHWWMCWIIFRKLAYWSGVGLADNRELVWVNRAGNRLQTLGTPNAFESVALSPDEKTVAASVGSRPRADIWLVSSANGSIARFTFGLTGSVPIWSFDGRLIVYARRNGFNTDIVRKQVAGGAEEVLLANVVNGVPRDVSPDGTLVVHEMSVAKTAYDIGLLAVDGDHRESVYLNSPASERYARFSPDGKWMAYQSDESGQSQVYVQTIPAGGGKYQISQSGGTTPAWRRDGRELFFLTPDRKAHGRAGDDHRCVV